MIGSSTSQLWTQGSAPPSGERRRSARVGDPLIGVPTAEQLESERSAAYEAGRRDGIAEGQATARQNAEMLYGQVVREVGRLVEGQQVERQQLAVGMIELAIEVATAVLGRTPHDGGAALIERLRSACGGSLQAVTTVQVSPVDVEAVRSAMSGINVGVEADPQLGPGEARMSGDWSSSAATVGSITEVIRRHLAEVMEAPETTTTSSGEIG